MEQTQKQYTGRTAQRGSFNGDVHYREFITEDGTLKWEGFGEGNAYVADFHEVRDSVPERWRTDLEGVVLPEPSDPDQVAKAGIICEYDPLPGAMYKDWRSVRFFSETGQPVELLTRRVRYALVTEFTQGRCWCGNDPDQCDCLDEFFEDYHAVSRLRRVTGDIWEHIHRFPWE